MDRPDYRVVIELKNVSVGDVTTLAQKIWDEEADDFDASLGEFEMKIVKVNGPNDFNVDWQPDE